MKREIKNRAVFRSAIALVLVLMVVPLAVGMPANAVVDNTDDYTFTGLGGGGAASALMWADGKLYAGMDNGHIWYYDGTLWNDFASLGGSVRSLAWDGVRIYAGMDSGVICVYEGGTWSGAGGASQPITCMHTSTTAPGIVYAGCSDGNLYELFFRGHADWNWGVENNMGYPICSMYSTSSYLYVGCSTSWDVWSGLGGSWQVLGDPNCGTNDPQVIYNNSIGLVAMGYNGWAWHYHGGDTWSNDHGNVTGPVTSVCNVGSTLYAGNYRGECWYYGGGTTWNALGSPYGLSSANAVRDMVSDGTNLYISYANGHVGKYTNGTTFSDLWPTSGTNVTSLVSNGNVYAGCGTGQVYEYDGTGWAAYGNNIGSPVISLGATSSHIYAGREDGNIYSYNSGTWTLISNIGSAPNAFAYNGTNLFAGCADGHLRYLDEATVTWIDVADLASGSVNALAWTGTELYAGTNSGEVYRYNGPGDVTATGLNTGGSATIALCWNTPKLYASTDGGQVHRYDGTSWDNVRSLPIGGETIHSLASDGITVFGGTASGKVLRYMGGTDWVESGSTGFTAVEALCWTGSFLFTGSASGSYKGTITVPPSVTSNAAASVTKTGATLNGNITDIGGRVADSRGFKYRKAGDASWTEWMEAGSFGTGAFSHQVTGLEPGTEYEYKACAQNPAGWGYGSILKFKTLANPTVTSVTPSSGPAGGQVTVSGNNFGAEQGSSTVTVGGVTAQVVSWSDTQIVIIIPGGSDGGAVVVTTGAGGSNTDQDFTVTGTSTWYLAEGSNAWDFNTYITIENPNDEELTARVTYLDPNPPASGNGIAKNVVVTLPPLSQTTVSSEPDIGEVDFSTRVECLEGKSIAVDRTMFWTGPDPGLRGYHSSIGTTSPSKTWYLPEGSSNWGFETWTLVENPNPTQANVKLTYMTEDRGAVVSNKVVPPNSRATYSMSGDIGVADTSIKVESDLPVVTERSMYRNNRREGSCSIGAAAPANDFFLAEGATGYGAGFTTYVLVQNPNGSANDVKLTCQTGSGEVEGPAFTMGPNSRKTVRVNDSLPPDTDVSTMVHGSKPLVAERAMYWGNSGGVFHASIGLPEPHMAFMLPDGQNDGNSQTWTLVANPNPGAVTVKVRYMPQGGGEVKEFTDEIPANSRRSYNMADHVTGRASILVESQDGARPIIVERAMYGADWGYGTVTIGGYAD